MSKPLTPWRRAITKYLIIISSKLILFAHGMSLSTREIPFDYSPWLGKDYKQKKPNVKRVSTIVMNHSTMMDMISLTAQGFMPSFAAKGSLEKVPVMGMLIKVVQGLFLNRAGTPAEREAAC